MQSGLRLRSLVKVSESAVFWGKVTGLMEGREDPLTSLGYEHPQGAGRSQTLGSEASVHWSYGVVMATLRNPMNTKRC